MSCGRFAPFLKIFFFLFCASVFFVVVPLALGLCFARASDPVSRSPMSIFRSSSIMMHGDTDDKLLQTAD